LTLPDPDDAQIPGWAEGPNENTDDPEIYRERGYQDPDSFASADLNKNLQQIYRWIDTALEGGAARLTGDYGEVEIGNDDSSLFELVINAGSQGLASLTSWALDQIKVIKIKGNGVTFIEVVDQNDNASGFLLESLRAVTGINDLIKILDEDGNPGEGGLLLNILSPGTSDEIDVENSSQQTGLGGMLMDFIRSAPGGGSLGVTDTFNFKSNSGADAEGIPAGINTAKAGALVDFSGQTPTSGDTLNTQFEWGLGSAPEYDPASEGSPSGVYQFDFAYPTTPLQANLSADVSFIGTDTQQLDYRVEQKANNDCRIRVFDETGTLVDPPSSTFLVKFYFTLG
jgi:hypothetical protein